MRFLVTGGAGFIGSNAAHRFREMGHEVVVYDNFSRSASALQPGLARGAPAEIRFIAGDVRDAEPCGRLCAEPFDVILHLAAPGGRDDLDRGPAPTTRSTPWAPFGCSRRSAGVTRARRRRLPLLIYASTNKVYGHLSMGRDDPRRALATSFQSPGRSLARRSRSSFESRTAAPRAAGTSTSWTTTAASACRRWRCASPASTVPGSSAYEDQGWVAWFVTRRRLRAADHVLR